MQELTMNEIEQVNGGYTTEELGAAVVGGAVVGAAFGSVAGGVGAGPGGLAGAVAGGGGYLISQLYMRLLHSAE